jgi:hypothetical protein
MRSPVRDESKQTNKQKMKKRRIKWTARSIIDADRASRLPALLSFFFFFSFFFLFFNSFQSENARLSPPKPSLAREKFSHIRVRT